MKKTIIGLVVLVILIGGGYLVFHKTSTPKNNSSTASSSDTTSTSSNSSTKMDSMNASSNSSSDQSAVATTSVGIQDFAFSPATIKVKVGDKVTWTNNDSVPHTVTADSGNGPNSGTLNPGKSYSFTYTSAGTFAYHCNFHSSMHGTVTVE